MPRLAVLGDPVSHSRSPAMQNAALAELGLAPEWSYEAIRVDTAGFEALVRSLPDEGFAGVNVTVPHKVAALAAADEADAASRAIGAANTLIFAAGRIVARNTDALAVVAALPRPPRGMRALVMGAGGSGRAAAWALREAGAAVEIWNRTPDRAAALAQELSVAHAPEPEGRFDLLVNATSAGLEQANAAPDAAVIGAGTEASALKGLPIDADAVSAEVVMDLVYGISETQLVRAARAAGATVIDGLEILVRQGAESLRMWTGVEPPVDVMRLAARGGSADGHR
jgi:shikimate dehydrogenase